MKNIFATISTKGHRIEISSNEESVIGSSINVLQNKMPKKCIKNAQKMEHASSTENAVFATGLLKQRIN